MKLKVVFVRIDFKFSTIYCTVHQERTSDWQVPHSRRLTANTAILPVAAFWCSVLPPLRECSVCVGGGFVQLILLISCILNEWHTQQSHINQYPECFHSNSELECVCCQSERHSALLIYIFINELTCLCDWIVMFGIILMVIIFTLLSINMHRVQVS